ncbi:MAG: hypothetical protein AUI14_15570 [Actinobacteria bacterium 13_2_20CM_2_71_6]|nr:MAG: hypothetical protein AUI14_15570 [Actinobacteria bacterium 13_2_20CM_2_71_6]
MTAHPQPDAARPAANRHRPRIRMVAVSAAAVLMAGASIAVSLHAQASIPPVPSGWTQIFGDDFSGNGLNGGNWRVIQGTQYAPTSPTQFGTGEVETSTPAAVSVANGAMSITARGQGTGGWTAARVETNREDFQPPAGGKLRVEARLKLPEAPNGQSAGYWPAFWMLGAPYRGNWWNWPTVGEFDIMESVNGANRTWQTQHCGWLPPQPNVCNEKSGVGNNGPGGCTPACTKSFHRYTLDWSRADQSATYYVDGRQVWRTTRGVNIPANAWDAGFMGHGFIIILNIAMGGEMPCNTLGCLNGATTGGGHLDADYVVAYTGGANAPPPPLGPGDGGSTSPTPTPSTCGPLVSQGRPTTSSALEVGNYGPQNAVDGNPGTRWSSAWSDPQWMQVDLGSVQPITRVKLNWEVAYASAYQIQVSNNPNGPWTVALDNPFGAGGIEDLAVKATGRYVRMYGTQRATGYGYSLWEFEVYGGCGTGSPTATPTGTPTGTPTTAPPTGGTGHYPAWAPNVAYHIGDRVSYAGLDYQCQQAHTSIVSWEPPNTPALWIKL